MRGQVQGLGHASDAAASNSARRDHGVHCRRQTTKNWKKRTCTASNHLKPSKSNRHFFETPTTAPKLSKTESHIHQRPNTALNNVTQEKPPKKNWEQIETTEKHPGHITRATARNKPKQHKTNKKTKGWNKTHTTWTTSIKIKAIRSNDLKQPSRPNPKLSTKNYNNQKEPKELAQPKPSEPLK